MNKRKIVPLVALAFLWPAMSNATLLSKVGVLAALQADSHERVGREDVTWLKLPGSWGAVDCPNDWAWFNAKTSPQLLATALTARAAGAEVQIYVDDGMPKMGGYCQVMMVVL